MGCYAANEPWSTSFLLLALGQAGYDCTQIDVHSCTNLYSLNPALPASVQPQYRHVLKNINGTPPIKLSTCIIRGLTFDIAINDFFTSWFLALPYATQQAELIIQDVISELDPEKKTNSALTDILIALIAGLAFTGVEGAAARAAATLSVTKIAGQALLTALQQAPGVARALWSSGTANSQSIQIGDLDSELGNPSDRLQNLINNGMGMTITDIPPFVGFACASTFSGSTSSSILAGSQGLDLALKTYVISSAFAANGWIAAIDPTNPALTSATPTHRNGTTTASARPSP